MSASAESVAANSPLRETRNIPSGMSARAWGAPALTIPAAYSASSATTRLMVRPVISLTIAAMSVRSRSSADESRAVNLIHAAGMGAVLSILSMPAALQDVGLGDAMYDAVLDAILTSAPVLPVAQSTASVVAFWAVVPDLPSLSDAERALMTQWLDRAIDAAS